MIIMSDWDNFNAVFWTGIATLLFSFLTVSIKACLSSKCDSVSLCNGMIQIHRKVELEHSDSDEEKDKPTNNDGKKEVTI
jgi:hypothetical protein